jgi:MYXO-CTERM domain-containing protein
VAWILLTVLAMRSLPPLLLLLPAVALAGAPTHSPTEIEVGTDPVAVEVAVGDRVVAALLGVDTSTVSWIDTADFDDGPFTATVSGAGARSLAAGQVAGADALFVGGEQVDVLVFDVDTTPLTSPGEGSAALLGDGASVSAMAVRGELMWAADAGRGELHCIDWVSGVPQVDTLSAAWPMDLGFAPVDIAWLDANLMIAVGGQTTPQAALIDLTTLSSPVLELLNLDGLTEPPVAVVGDESGQAWVLEPDGSLWIVESAGLGDDDDAGDDDDSAGDDDDSAGDDDDSAGDDDDSADGDAGDDDDSAGDDDDSADGEAGDDDDSTGDDDDSAGDDDDSAGDDDDSAGPAGPAPADGWMVNLLATGLPTPAVDLAFRNDSLWPTILALGDNDVAVLDDFGFEWDRIALSTAGTGLAMASVADGFSYASVGGTGQVAVLAPGPWVRFNTISTQSLSTDDESIDVTFTVDLGDDGGTCDYRLALGADIAGGGTDIAGASGTAEHAQQVQVTLDGAALSSGSQRVWLFCEDLFGEVGRASFTYYKGGLTAPTSFSAARGNASVTLSWDGLDDSTVASYRVYFSDAEFTDEDTPDFCDSASIDCSGFDVAADEATGDDDDSADDSTTVTDFSRTISNLINGQTYWFSVAAVDVDGNLGSRTAVLSATPTAAGGAASLAGEPLGCSCSSAPAAPASLLLLALLGILRLRRNTP